MAVAAKGGGEAPAITVSIVVPAYDDAAYVERALESCLRQTHRDVQVICVDDGSGDDTAARAEALAAGDSRLTVVRLRRNAGTHDARAAGLALVTGQVVTFLDADDELSRDACACMAAQFAQEPYDILQFGVKVRGEGADARQAREVCEWLRPFSGSLSGRDILVRSFSQLDYAFNLAGKAYRAPLAKRAFDELGPLRLDFGEDALEYFAIAYFAGSYRGLPARRLYTYHLGDGLSAQGAMTAAQFERNLRGVASIGALRGFLERQGALEELADVYEAHCRNQLDALMRAWAFRVRAQDAAACLQKVLSAWPADAVVAAACRLGSPVLERVRELAGVGEQLSVQQAYALGLADGQAQVRAEYESSGSYKLGRALSALPRKALGRA